MVDATVVLKSRSGAPQPPARKQQPRTWRDEGQWGVEGAKERVTMTATHEKHIGQDAAEHAGLHDTDLVLLEGHDGDDELDGVAKGGVAQAAQCLAQFRRQLFGSEAQQRGQRDDGDEVEDEDGGGAPADVAGDYAQRHEDEQDVDVVAGERRPRRVGDIPGQRPPARLVATGATRFEAAEQRRALVWRAIQLSRHGRAVAVGEGGGGGGVAVVVVVIVVLAGNGQIGAVATDTVEFTPYVLCYGGAPRAED